MVYYCSVTGQHGFVDYARAGDQHGVAWHDAPVRGQHHDVTGHQAARVHNTLLAAVLGRSEYSHRERTSRTGHAMQVSTHLLI